MPHYDLGSGRTGFGKLWRKFQDVFSLLDEYAYGFKRSICIVIPGLVSSTEVFTHTNIDPMGFEKWFILFVYLSEARPDPGRRASKNRKNFSTDTQAMPPLHASWRWGLWHQLDIFYPVGIEVCHTTPLDLGSTRTGFEKIVKKVPVYFPFTRWTCVRFQHFFLHRDSWACVVNWSVCASILTQQVSGSNTFYLSTSLDPDPTPAEERGKIK